MIAETVFKKILFKSVIKKKIIATVSIVTRNQSVDAIRVSRISI